VLVLPGTRSGPALFSAVSIANRLAGGSVGHGEQWPLRCRDPIPSRWIAAWACEPHRWVAPAPSVAATHLSPDKKRSASWRCRGAHAPDVIAAFWSSNRSRLTPA